MQPATPLIVQSRLNADGALTHHITEKAYYEAQYDGDID